MEKVPLSKAALENLIQHLVEIEEERDRLVGQYFPDPSRERNEFEKLMKEYMAQVEQFIGHVHASQAADSFVPFVLVGSEVEIEDVQSGDLFKYRIVSPLHDAFREEDVSFLSPVGKSLLLKKVGDEVEVKAPGGIFRYRIKSIQLSFNVD